MECGGCRMIELVSRVGSQRERRLRFGSGELASAAASGDRVHHTTGGGGPGPGGAPHRFDSRVVQAPPLVVSRSSSASAGLLASHVAVVVTRVDRAALVNQHRVEPIPSDTEGVTTTIPEGGRTTLPWRRSSRSVRSWAPHPRALTPHRADTYREGAVNIVV